MRNYTILFVIRHAISVHTKRSFAQPRLQSRTCRTYRRRMFHAVKRDINTEVKMAIPAGSASVSIAFEQVVHFHPSTISDRPRAAPKILGRLEEQGRTGNTGILLGPIHRKLRTRIRTQIASFDSCSRTALVPYLQHVSGFCEWNCIWLLFPFPWIPNYARGVAREGVGG